MSKESHSLDTLSKIFEEGVVLKAKVIELGDWDMNATGALNVAHEFTGNDWKKIRSIDIVIRNDADDTYTQSPGVIDGTGLSAEMGVENLQATNIRLARKAGSIFDAVGYETPPDGNRGWATIWYEA